MGFLYQFVKYSGRIGLPIFFGKFEINGREHIPEDLPFLIAPNHQNAFLDAILMGVYNQKPVHFLTRSDVFVPPFVGALQALNMMPIYRIRDGYDKLSKNEAVFEICERLLGDHQPVLIFPEGNMDKHHFLRPLTKGTARLALQTQMNLAEDLLILPVGINYFDHYRPRHKCIVNFGVPLRVNDYMARYQQHSAKGLISLRNDLSDAIKGLLLIPEKEGYDSNVQALNHKNEALSFKELRQKIGDNDFDRARYTPWLSPISRFLTFLNPVAIYIVRYILSRKLKQRQFIASIKYTLGLLLSVLWWIILFSIITTIWNWKVGSIVVLISILSLLFRSELIKRSTPPEI